MKEETLGPESTSAANKRSPANQRSLANESSVSAVAVNSQHQRQMSLRAKRENALTAMLVVTCLGFLVCKSPVTVLIIGGIACEDFSGEFKDAATILETLNHAGNFLIYFAAGSKFRAACRRLFNKATGRL